MGKHNDFGKWAENFAVEYLENKGYKILERNYFYQKAEIDIIAQKGNFIVIVEVKARNSEKITTALQAVDSKKRKLLIQVANHFLEEHNLDTEVRFDIICVIPHTKENFYINHIQSAFEIID